MPEYAELWPVSSEILEQSSAYLCLNIVILSKRKKIDIKENSSIVLTYLMTSSNFVGRVTMI